MTAESERDVDWGRRALWIGALLVLLVVALLAASATVPRWWAHRVGDQVDGSITQGTLLGLFYGFVFTFVPILVLVLILRWRRTPRAIAVALLLAIVLALPNLMTLGIVLGRGNAAHAGDRVLDVEAPAFRGGLSPERSSQPCWSGSSRTSSRPADVRTTLHVEARRERDASEEAPS